MKKKFVLLYLILLFFFTVVGVRTVSAETKAIFRASAPQTAAPGELVEVQVHTEGNPAAFRLQITYEKDKMELVKVKTSSKFKSSTLETNTVSNPLVSVYVCNTDLNMAPELDGESITYVFRALTTVEGNLYFKIHVDQICGWDEQQLDQTYEQTVTVGIDPEKLGKAYLTALQPSEGTLIPEFSSSVYDYSVEVPYEVNSITFRANAGEGGTIKVSRKTLQKAGTTTPVVITVTSADKTEKTRYVVAVHRLNKGESPTNKQYATGIKSGKISPNDTEYQDGYTPESLASGSSQGDRILNVGGNQFPVYLIVILLAGIFLVLVVIAVQMVRKSKVSEPAKEKGPEDQPPNKTEGQKK